MAGIKSFFLNVPFMILFWEKVFVRIVCFFTLIIRYMYILVFDEKLILKIDNPENCTIKSNPIQAVHDSTARLFL